MLRLSKLVLTGVGAVALLASAPAFAQAGLGSRLDAQEQQLAQAEKTCGPVNLAEYANLLQEASQNKQRADKAKKKGVPVDEAQVNADLAKAMSLFARAQSAQARNCMMQAQQQPQNQSIRPRLTGGDYGQALPADGQGTAGLNTRLDDAEKKLADDIKACRPIKADDYQPLVDEMRRNLKAGRQALEKGVPVDVDKLLSDSDRASKLMEQAKAAEAKQDRVCPPKNEAKNEPPKTTGAVPSAAPERVLGVTHQIAKDTSVGVNMTYRNRMDTVWSVPRVIDSEGKTRPVTFSDWDQRILDAQNAERASVGAPPLKWNEELAQHASEYAHVLAQTGQLVHAPREGRGTERENLQKGLIGWSPERMIQDWAKEKNNFVAGNFPDVARDGNWLNVAHYTQMIWPTTTDVGCGSAVGGGFNWFVCRYNPGGNKDGKLVGQPGIKIAERAKEAPLPPTDTSRVHQTPMAQPQGDGSAARMAAYDVRIPWNQPQPMQPTSQPMTPPPESVLDDIGQSPPPESILDDVGDNLIRPRLIGGDYGSDADIGIYDVGPTGGLNDLFPNLALFGDVLIRDFAGGADVTRPRLDRDLIDGGYDFRLSDNDVFVFQTPAPFTVILIGEQPLAPTVAHSCPVDFGSRSLSRQLDQAETDLNNKLAAGAWIDPADYEKLAEEAAQQKNAAIEEDRATGGTVDPTLFNQNYDKAQHLLKKAQAAAARQSVDTKVEAPDLGKTPAVLDPNAPSPIDLKLSDCVM